MKNTLRTLWLVLLALVLGFAVQAQQRFNNLTILTNLTVQGSATITNATAANLTVDGAKPTLYVTNVAAMRALTGLTSGQLIQTAGRTTPGYGGATFLWTAGLTTTTNLGTVFDLATGGTGRFTLAHGDPGDIRLWGAIPGSGDDASAIQAAINSLTATTFGGAAKPQLFIPSGQWHVGSTLNITNPIAIRGEGIELNSVNVSAYSLNGSVLVSTITGGDPVIHVVGRDAGSGNTYIQGIEFKDFGIDGSTTDGAGIWWDCNSNLSDCYTSRILVRRVGGSSFKGGDGTQSGSPRYGYSTFEELTSIFPGLDSFEFYCEQLATVKMRWVGLYSNGPGRHSFNFWNMGDFYAERWIENNAAQSQSGNGANLVNINNAIFNGFYVEGDGRNQSSGGSYTPVYSSRALALNGVTRCTFIGGTATSPSGAIGGLTNSGVVEIVSSVATNGFTARGSIGNRFINCNYVGYTPTLGRPTAVAAGSGGSLSAGVYRYRVTGVYTGMETPITGSNERVVSAVASNSIALSDIPIVSATLGTNTVTGRKVWRTAANGTVFKLLTTISNNISTTYTDTTADASLGADADFAYQIYLGSDTGENHFEAANFPTQPLVYDAGLKNTFDTVYIASDSPTAQALVGKGSWNNTFSSGAVGQRHFFGADNSGAYVGYGLTAATAKRASFVIPSYQSSRFAQSQATLLDGQITDTANLVTIGGGNSSDYAATEVALYAASGVTTTTGTKQLRVTSAGTQFINSVDFDSSATVDATFTYSVAPVLNNNVWLLAKDSGGTARELIGKAQNDIIRIGSGSGSERINILPGTGGLFLGQAGVSASIYVPRINTASSTNTLRNSQTFGYVASYWNGSAEVQYDATTRLSMDSTAPTASLYWALGGTDRMQLKSDGTLRVVTGPIQLVTVTISTGSGSPEGVVTAATGSIYMNTSGGAGTTFYVKETGSGNTGWVAK